MSVDRPPAGADRWHGLGASVRVLVREAERLLMSAQPADAAQRLDRALAEAGAHAELLRLRALADLYLGQPAQAVERLHRAIAARPGDALIATQLGGALAQAGDRVAAEAWFRSACAWAPGSIDAWYNLGVACLLRGAAAEARDALERVLAIDPKHVPARVRLAEAGVALGHLDVAEKLFRSVLDDDATSVPAWSGLAGLARWQPDAAALASLLQLQASGRVHGAHAISLDFACAQFLERAGRLDQAYAMFAQANARKRATLGWDSRAVSALVGSILDALARPLEVDDEPLRGSGIVFIVGLPRSGSTLLEQILSAHPEVHGAGETNGVARLLQGESERRGRAFPQWVAHADAGDWRRLGHAYLAEVVGRHGAHRLLTDKTLANWQVVGAIRRMLPAARIVHCRRDPLETLWSAFRQHFGEGQAFSYDFDDLVAFWRDCTWAMAAWQQHIPDILVHDHEALLDDPESTVRALLDAIGLPFDRTCLDFHHNPRTVHTASAAQVRRPLQRTLGAAARYGEHLVALAARIEAAKDELRRR